VDLVATRQRTLGCLPFGGALLPLYHWDRERRSCGRVRWLCTSGHLDHRALGSISFGDCAPRPFDCRPPTARHRAAQVAGNGRTHRAVRLGVRVRAGLQTYEMPATTFLAANPDLDLSNITAVDVTFDGRIAGSVLIDELGSGNSTQRLG